MVPPSLTYHIPRTKRSPVAHPVGHPLHHGAGPGDGPLPDARRAQRRSGTPGGESSRSRHPSAASVPPNSASRSGCSRSAAARTTPSCSPAPIRTSRSGRCWSTISPIASCEDAELRDGYDYTWHLIGCVDPDGTRLNEGWFAGPFTPRNYARHFYRPILRAAGRVDLPDLLQEALLRPRAARDADADAGDRRAETGVDGLAPQRRVRRRLLLHLRTRPNRSTRPLHQIPDWEGSAAAARRSRKCPTRSRSPRRSSRRSGWPTATTTSSRTAATRPQRLRRRLQLRVLRNPTTRFSIITEVAYFDDPRVNDQTPTDAQRRDAILAGSRSRRRGRQRPCALTSTRSSRTTSRAIRPSRTASIGGSNLGQEARSGAQLGADQPGDRAPGNRGRTLLAASSRRPVLPPARDGDAAPHARRRDRDRQRHAGDPPPADRIHEGLRGLGGPPRTLAGDPGRADPQARRRPARRGAGRRRVPGRAACAPRQTAPHFKPRSDYGRTAVGFDRRGDPDDQRAIAKPRSSRQLLHHTPVDRRAFVQRAAALGIAGRPLSGSAASAAGSGCAPRPSRPKRAATAH